MKKKIVSIVLPCLNESKNLPTLIPEIIKFIPRKYNYEIICVDDGSSDNSREVLQNICRKNKAVEAIFLHRRFGHQAALKAGIDYAKGDAVVNMDADFQHSPKVIPLMIQFWEKGYDLVRAQKKEDRSVSLFMKVKRGVAYSIWYAVTGGIIPPGVSDFRLMDITVVNYLKQTNEHELFFRGLLTLGAKRIKTVPYTVEKRRYGKSSYTLKMFINMFVNGFISFSVKPLRIGWIAGLTMTVLTGGYIMFDLLTSVINNRPIIEGFKTIVLLLVLFNGFLLFYLGIMAEYIGIIFKEVKKRPLYMIDETINISS